jgi:hypothetical protein
MSSISQQYTEVKSKEWERGNYALIGVGLLSFAVIALAAAVAYQLHIIDAKRVAIVFADDIGELHPVDYQSHQFMAQDAKFSPVIKGALYRWCRDYYERRRDTIIARLDEARYFMNLPRAEELKAAIRSGLIDEFMENAAAPQIMVSRQNVTIENMTGCGHAKERLCTGTVSIWEDRDSDGKRRFCSVPVEFGFGLPDDDLINSIGLAAINWHIDCGAWAAK